MSQFSIILGGGGRSHEVTAFPLLFILHPLGDDLNLKVGSSGSHVQAPEQKRHIFDPISGLKDQPIRDEDAPDGLVHHSSLAAVWMVHRFHLPTVAAAEMSKTDSYDPGWPAGGAKDKCCSAPDGSSHSPHGPGEIPPSSSHWSADDKGVA